MATSFSGGRSRSSINWFDLIWFLVINDTFSLFQLYHGDQLSGGRSRSNRFSYIMATSFSGGRSRSTRRESFSYIMATSFSGGGSRSTRWEPPTMGKQLVNFITCSCESAISWRAVLVVEEAGVPGENTDHGQATGKLYHLRLWVDCK